MDKSANYFFPNLPRWQQLGLMILIFAYIIAFAILPSGFDFPYYYMPALAEEKPMYYPYWTYWVLAPLTVLPFKANYLIFILGLLLSLVWILRLTKGNAWFLLLSFPLIWVLWYGQIESLVALGIAIIWHGAQERDARLLGLGLFLASLKPHIAGPVTVTILWHLKNWPLRIKSFWLLGPIALLSLFRWGWYWPIQWTSTIMPTFQNSYNNGSLWTWFGPWALILWIPAILIPINRLGRFKLILSTTLLTMPYVPPYSQLVLYLFPMPLWIWIGGLLPWAQIIFGDIVFKFNFLVPISTTLMIYFTRSNYSQEIRTQDINFLT